MQPHPLAPLTVQPQLVTRVVNGTEGVAVGLGLPRVVLNTSASR
jgi:hypothetical protein